MASEPNSSKQPELDYTEPHDIARIHASVMREKTEPKDGMEPISLWMVALCGLFFFIGGAYLTQYSGGFRWDVFSEFEGSLGGAPGSKDAGAGAEKAEPTLVEIGERAYKNCVSCHNAQGTGQAGVYPPLAGSDWVLGNNRRLIKILLHGMEGPMTVNGQPYNGAMPPWGKTLDDKKIAGVLTYIRQSWGNNASEVTPEMVALVREETKTRTKVWTEPELLQVTEEVVIEAPAAPAEAPGEAPAEAAPAAPAGNG